VVYKDNGLDHLGEQIYLVRNLTPAPPPFSAMNSTPALLVIFGVQFLDRDCRRRRPNQQWA